jgi:hypothetical protein
MHDKKIYNKKINRMVLSSCENYLIAADTIGNVFTYDVRKSKFKFI